MASRKGQVLLVDFISKLVNSEALQRRVLANPDQAMQRFGLTPMQIKVLKSHDGDRIGRAITSELRSFSRDFIRKNPEA
jgi:hypothetical protein